MKKKMILSVTICITLLISLFLVSQVFARPKDKDPGRAVGSVGFVYVRSQGLYYETFVPVNSLPPNGRFQELEPQGEGIPSETDYGPGDPGYLGGRWWIDNTEGGIEGQMDPTDTYLLCPLLPPGLEELP